MRPMCSIVWPKHGWALGGVLMLVKPIDKLNWKSPGHLFRVARVVPVDWSQLSNVAIFCRITLCRSLLLSSVLGTKLADFVVVCSCTAADEAWSIGGWWKASKVFCVPFPKRTQMLSTHSRTKLFKKVHPWCPAVTVFFAPHRVGKSTVGPSVSRMEGT